MHGLGLTLFLIIFFFLSLWSFNGATGYCGEMAKAIVIIVAFSLIPLLFFEAYKRFADGNPRN
jgi:hypothetical protein